jgi:uncharacterized protein (DUF488 family)
MNLTNKRKVILSLFEKIGDSITAKCLQKYLFIFTRMQNGERIYDFVPYKYGCFSFQANQDIVILAKNGYLSIENDHHSECRYKLTMSMDCFHDLDMYDAQAIEQIKTQFKDMTQDELIAYTYRRWPFTAINSVIKNRLLNNEELQKVDEMRKRYQSNESVLMTIGYEGMSLEKYLQRLITNDIHVLCDVRKNAFSMKYGFSKAILKKACEGIGIQYIHVPELGIASELRQDLQTQADYNKLFDLYEQTTLKENKKALLFVRDIIDKYKRVCLTCFEKDPRQCHRTRVAKALMNLPNVNYKFREIIL